MRRLMLSVVCVLGSLCADGAGAAAAVGEGSASTVFRKDLGNGSELVITRQAVDMALLGPVWASTARADRKAFVFSALIRQPGAEEIPIGSHVQIESKDSNQVGFCVLDALVEEGEVGVAFGAGRALGMWRISFGRRLPFVSQDAIAWLGKWQLSPRTDPVSEAIVAVKISRMTDGRLRVSVTDKRVGGGGPSIFEQAQGEWAFPLVEGFWKQRGRR